MKALQKAVEVSFKRRGATAKPWEFLEIRFSRPF